MSQTSSSTAPLLAGFTGGLVATIVLFPLDIIKTRLQVHEDRSHRLRSMRVVSSILRHEGFRGLYAGWTPAVVGSSVSWGGYFFFYEGLKRRLIEHRTTIQSSSGEGRKASLNSMDNFILACLSGGIMVAITNPIWLIKTRMQLQMRNASEKHNIKPYTGMVDAVRTIIREEGFLALYRGSGPAFLLTSHGGVQFVVYEYLKKHFHYQRAKRDETSNAWERFARSTGFVTMGAISKIAASMATYPLQVIKSRMQRRSHYMELGSNGEVEAVHREYHGMWTTARKMWMEEGISGFFKGAIPNAIRVAPASAITFLVYEGMMDWLD